MGMLFRSFFSSAQKYQVSALAIDTTHSFLNGAGICQPSTSLTPETHPPSLKPLHFTTLSNDRKPL